MLSKIKNNLEKELPRFLAGINSQYGLSKISPLLFRHIREFVLRDGKRIRPALFVIGYLGFAEKPAPRLYTSALALELLHDFMLVHDDIIDKSATRRGRPSLHVMLEGYLSGSKDVRFNGQDLAIVMGDVMYAIGIHAFLEVKENQARKEAALKKFIEAAIYTGSGEFIELLAGLKDIADISKDEIYRIYDYKTACYSFASPLSSGAILAGASGKEAEKLFDCGIYLGRAFQIKDDILGTFGSEKKIGKSTLTDLKESKKTIILWQAFQRGGHKEKTLIKRVLAKKKVGMKDLRQIREIMVETGVLDCAKKEISSLISRAAGIIDSSAMKKQYRLWLRQYSNKLLEA